MRSTLETTAKPLKKRNFKKSKGAISFINQEATCSDESDDEIIQEATLSDVEFINDDENDM